MTRTDPGERRKRNAIAIIALALFAVGLPLPALTFTGVEGYSIGQSTTLIGAFCLVLGPFLLGLMLHFVVDGDTLLGLAWLGNVVLALALWFVWRGQLTRRTTLVSGAALALALLPLLTFVVPATLPVCCETLFATNLTAIGPGYVAWVSSATVVLAGGLAIARDRASAAGLST